MDISLYYEEKGTGAPLILLHGNGENGEYFRHQTEYFQKVTGLLPWTPEDTENHPEEMRPLPWSSSQRI